MHILMKLLIYGILLTPLSAYSKGAVTKLVSIDGSYKVGNERIPWTISEKGQLVWNGMNTSLVGNRWSPVSLTSASESDVLRDALYLDAVAKKPDSCVWLQLPMGGLTSTATNRLQRILDMLELRSIPYGLAIKARASVTGSQVIVHPSRLRSVVGIGRTPIPLRIPMMRSCWTVVCLTTGEVIEHGQEAVTDSTVICNIKGPIENGVCIFLPELDLADGLATLFSDTDDLRDRVLESLSKLKFGKHLRFLSDPLDLPVFTTIEDRRKIPTTLGFRRAWSGYLKDKYGTIDSALIGWRIDRTERIDDFDTLARLLPLSFDGRGTTGFLDPINGSRYIHGEAQSALFWSDLASFIEKESTSLQGLIALAVTRAGLDVPVVNTCSVRTSNKGLSGVVIRSSNVVESAVHILDRGLAMMSPWTVIDNTDIASSGFQPSTWGATGVTAVFFPETTVDRLSSGKLEPIESASIVPMPLDLVRHAKQLDNGSWWLPDSRPMRMYNYPNGISAYGLTEGDQTTYYFSGRKTPAKITIKLPKALGKSTLSWSPVSAGLRTKDALILNVNDSPIAVRGFGNSLPVPFESLTAAVEQSKGLVSTLRKRNIPDAGRIQLELSKFDGKPDFENPQAMYSAVQTLMDANQRMVDILRPFSFLYVEAEGMPNLRMTHTWDGIVSDTAASGGKVLHISANPIGNVDPVASYNITVNNKTIFNTFYACTGKVRMRINGKSTAGEGVGQTTSLGLPYTKRGVTWYKGGTIELGPGSHTIEFLSNGACDLDAFMLSVDSSLPNGNEVPAIKVNPTTP